MKTVHYIYDLDDQISFGKYSGKTIKEILDINPDYFCWCIENLGSFALSAEAMAVLSAAVEQVEDSVTKLNNERLQDGETQKHRLQREENERDRYEAKNDYDEYDDGYGSHFGEFAGSYAQDVEGFSDDVINDAFEGDPDLYWNID